MSCATMSEPKDLLRLLVESAGATEDAVRQEHHHYDEEQADPEIPVLRVRARELVARHHVNDGADDAAVEPARAAEDEDHEDVGRAPEGKHLERHGRGGVCEERSGD